ncbi:hypothetical protein MSAN_00103500 [Mycena sanguinolenta]|uniref:Uncharacterized protein n=1 Tax=Mycena sanguinolenta TaxID=230812 RepID=A0A8H6ZD63_9AGAR|nr:hypothetical protein MSAN_00103500 [Mycena sanguinolenta]
MSQAPTMPEWDPAALLGPEMVRELQVATLVIAGTTAVLIWDILRHLGDDYYLLFKYKFRLATAAYFMSSQSCIFALHLGFTLFATYPIPDCQTTMTILNCGLLVSSSATSLLFFLRVRAVYRGQRVPTLVFGFLWICVVAAAVTVPISTQATRVGTLCLVTKVPSYSGVASTVLMVNDTSIVLAISYRLLANTHHDHSVGDRFRTFFSGAPHPHSFSKAVFRDGQKYYIITIVSNAVTISMVYATALSPIYHSMMSIPNVTLMSIMASRVYRNATLHQHPRAMSIQLSATNNSRTWSVAPKIHVPIDTDPQDFSVEKERNTTAEIPKSDLV